ncbi:hypothetical protein GCM10009117_22070 [Gangjinia marincola]|uniref:Uncharacterized protein n=1 Tax=Gangjinia marincola TaxID=578463 RepID=A0ABP3XX92_9FLAO
MEKNLKLIWDFRGPTAKQTAEHHEIHLKEYSTAQNLTLTTTGTMDISELYSIAYMIVTPTEMPEVRDALKPHRGQYAE